MAKQIIVLVTGKGPGGDTLVNWLFWLAVAAGRELPLPGAVSAWTGASVAENAAIAAGTVIEVAHAAQYPANFTKSQIEAKLSAQFTTEQAALTAAPNPMQFFGVFFDSVTGWSA